MGNKFMRWRTITISTHFKWGETGNEVKIGLESLFIDNISHFIEDFWLCSAFDLDSRNGFLR